MPSVEACSIRYQVAGAGEGFGALSTVPLSVRCFLARWRLRIVQIRHICSFIRSFVGSLVVKATYLPSMALTGDPPVALKEFM